MTHASPATRKGAPSPANRPRWGLFAVTTFAAAALVASAIWSWAGARSAAEGLTEARALTLRTSVARELRNRGDAVQPTLDSLLEDHLDEGLRYVALVQGKRIVGEAGEPSAGFDPADIGRGSGLQQVGERVRAVRPLRPRGGDRQKRRKVRRSRSNRPAGGTEGPAPMEIPEGRKPQRAAVLVLEIEPTLARALETRAVTGLLLSLLVATLLVGAAAAFWRLGRRADEAEAALQRQRHLAALGEMSAVLGHELKNPLASLKGHAQLLEEKLEEDSRERRKASRVVAEAVRLERLIQEVLAFVRSGTIERESVDPAALARSAASAVADASVEVEARGAPASWSLDPRRIERVLVNLVDNAARAGRDGPVTITVARVGADLQIAVRDRGAGVPSEDLERIFEPFVTTRTKGTGLGLAIARRIAEAHGGTLSASNHPDGGAELRLTLPEAPS